LEREHRHVTYQRLIARLVSAQTAVRAGIPMRTDLPDVESNHQEREQSIAADKVALAQKFAPVLEQVAVRKKRKDPTKFTQAEIAGFGLMQSEVAMFCATHPAARMYFDDFLEFGGLGDINIKHPLIANLKASDSEEVKRTALAAYTRQLKVPTDDNKYTSMLSPVHKSLGELSKIIDERTPSPELSSFIEICQETMTPLEPGFLDRVKTFFETATVEQKADFIAYTMELYHTKTADVNEAGISMFDSVDPFVVIAMNRIHGVDVATGSTEQLYGRLHTAVQEAEAKFRPAGTSPFQALRNVLAATVGEVDQGLDVEEPVPQQKQQPQQQQQQAKKPVAKK
jgi:hypothetical protein